MSRSFLLALLLGILLAPGLARACPCFLHEDLIEVRLARPPHAVPAGAWGGAAIYGERIWFGTGPSGPRVLRVGARAGHERRIRPA